MTDAQFDQLMAVLEDIRAALIGGGESTEESCQHEARVMFPTMTGTFWVCPVCKTDSRTLEAS